MFERGIEKDFPTKSPFFNGETLGFLDIIVAANSCTYRSFEEAVGVSYGLDKHQAFFSWVTALEGCTLIKETLPPCEKLVTLIRQMFLQEPKIKLCWINCYGRRSFCPIISCHFKVFFSVLCHLVTLFSLFSVHSFVSSVFESAK